MHAFAMESSLQPVYEDNKASVVDTSEIIAQRERYGKLLDLNGNEVLLPTYTIKEIYDAIPPECFERNIFKSMRYVLQDILGLMVTFWLFHKYATAEHVPSYLARVVLWTLYTFISALFAGGLWVLGHECGHMAFSPYKTFNDTLGLILHSLLLAPYFSWKITHRNHHKHNASMHKDTFVPSTKLAFAQRIGKTIETISEYAEDAPLYAFLRLAMFHLVNWHIFMTVMTGVGEHWFERQERGEKSTATNADGTLVRTYPLSGSHYNPYSPLFNPEDAKLIYITDLALLIVLSILCYIGHNYGWLNLLVYYGIPWLWINHWHVTLTYLQHTHPSIPHYNNSTWTFTRGASSTIDYDMGFIGRHFFHHIGETHVLHHHVSTIPHYHATRATEAIRKVMGVAYKKGAGGNGLWSFLKNYWEAGKSCEWVEACEEATGEGKDVLFFRGRKLNSKSAASRVIGFVIFSL